MKPIYALFCLVLMLALAGCGSETPKETTSEAGPHGGKMMRHGSFAIEAVIIEDKSESTYRLYAYEDNRPLPPAEVSAAMTLTRLGNEREKLSFRPNQEYLLSNEPLKEPHSFTVRLDAERSGKTYEWTYSAFENRTEIPADVAEKAGIVTALAGPVTIRKSLPLFGSITLNASRHSQVKARFNGTVRAVKVEEGERVKKGQPLVIVEGNESMRNYAVLSPLDGVVLAVYANTGDMAESNTLVEVADLSTVWVQLHAMGESASLVQPGQKLLVRSATGTAWAETAIETVLPLATEAQAVLARAKLANDGQRWHPGLMVNADVVLAEKRVLLAVQENAIQRVQGSDVVFVQAGETYEARPVALGERDGHYAEVIDGLTPGARYVSSQSFVIKADIEKSAAGHEH